MKIGIVLSNTPAYSETFFNSKIKGLIKNGIEVELFVSQSDESFDLCNVVMAPKVHANPIIQFLSMLYVFIGLLQKTPTVIRYIVLERKENTSCYNLIKNLYLNAQLLKSDLDWIHFGFATQAIGSELVAKAIKAKMGVSFRGFDINVYPMKHPNCYSLLWKHIDKVHSISKYLLHQAYDLGLSVKVPYQIITPAVALDALGCISNEKPKGKTLKILTIARLHWMKGVDLLIETAGLLKENKVDFIWKIIGDGDQKTTECYQFHIYEKKLKNQVVLLGGLSHEKTLKHLQNTDLYVQTSLNEGFCNAVLEAQATGVLSIATDVGGLAENIITTKTGWVVPKMNPIVLADKIKEVLTLPECQKEQIRIAARKRVVKEFSITLQQQKFVNFYKDVVKTDEV